MTDPDGREKLDPSQLEPLHDEEERVASRAVDGPPHHDDPGAELEDREEGVAVGATDRGRAANGALLALARATRSFTLYDAQNTAIRKFILSLQEKMSVALDGHGALSLVVRPFEMTMDGEVVYVERDRERSLAFRLYRDGVRRLEVDPAIGWEELLRLLEILSVRAKTMSSTEEDTVTLLRKTAFQHLRFVVVDGFQADEESPEDVVVSKDAGPRVATLKHNVQPPRDWDQPLPELEAASGVTYRPVPPAVQAGFAAEIGAGTLADAALRLITGLLLAVEDPADPITTDEILPFLTEVRDYLLLDEDLAQLGRLAVMLRRAPGRLSDDRDLHTAVLRHRDLLKHTMEIATQRGGDNTLEDNLFARFPEDAVEVAMEILTRRLERGAGRTDGGVIALVEILRNHVRTEPGLVLEALASGPSQVVLTLLPVLEKALPEHRAPVAMSLANHSDREVQNEALRLLDLVPLGSALVPTLQHLLTSPYAEVRQRGAVLIGRIGDETTFRTLILQIESRAGHDLGDEEAGALGEALARMCPALARDRFTEWVRPKGWLKRFIQTEGKRVQQVVAAYGLGALPGDDIDDLLRELVSRGDESVRNHTHGVLARRRKAARHG